jgi:hypothetical protein
MNSNSNWFVRHISLVISLVVVIVLAVIIVSRDKNSNGTGNSSSTTTSALTGPVTVPPSRQIAGQAVTLGTGGFVGGKDVEPGLYEVSAGGGESGNFLVTGSDSYNIILGKEGAAGGVLQLRAHISKGDVIQISGLTHVTFTPVTAPFTTAYTTTNLYSGTFIVGEDIGPGKYLVTPGGGENGNFTVTGHDKYNAVLGGAKSIGGVPSATVTLTTGDVINITSLNQVLLTPTP